jgi:hypothetical protein
VSGKRRQKKPNYACRFVRVYVCCNHADDGSFLGRADGLEIQRAGQTLSLELAGNPPRFTVVSSDAIRIFRRTIVTHSQANWVGNWCWNAYTLSVPDAAWFLIRALRGGLFSITGASGHEACSLSELLEIPVAPTPLVEAMLVGFKRHPAPKQDEG